MKDAYIYARAHGISYELFATPTSVASAHEAINAFGIVLVEKDYRYRSKAFHDSGRIVSSHLEQHAQSSNPELANSARSALQKIAAILS